MTAPNPHRIKKCDVIVACVREHPGLTAHEIAERCDMTRSRVMQLLCWVRRYKQSIRVDKNQGRARYYPVEQTVGDVARKHLNGGDDGLAARHVMTTLDILETMVIKRTATDPGEISGALKAHREALELAWGGK